MLETNSKRGKLGILLNFYIILLLSLRKTQIHLKNCFFAELLCPPGITLF